MKRLTIVKDGHRPEFHFEPRADPWDEGYRMGYARGYEAGNRQRRWEFAILAIVGFSLPLFGILALIVGLTDWLL